MPAQRSLLSDGRWHFQHGPIDIVIGAQARDAWGERAVADAHEAAWRRFVPLLDELVGELPLLRRPIEVDAEPQACPMAGIVARRMWHACAPFRAPFITPMAAVAGAVAQELIACYQREGIARAWVNNGGDIALHLAPGASARIGLYADIARLTAREALRGVSVDGQFEVTHAMPVRGVATSGWRGRSFSLGIADSVTVLADTAAAADAAATVIANAVDVDDAAIVRQPANELRDDSDLGAMPVTVDVPPLAPRRVTEALAAGLRRAGALQAAGRIAGAILVCQGQVRVTEGGLGGTAPGVSALVLGAEAGSVFARTGSVFA
ncbi:UPF0280 family protein [Hylemonella gracilis]|uniref:ApbE family lipoprotein n=1 Tax=Hylemonella gracilis ATCC 19624 TaxID=887062 RepID=F3KU76_9BURK|nr:UPF0280 family protein [Hylemonella gracilis]EGI76626.1 hypothetical protein HGR_10040 [Hylemonella gracilis ATCC 19624]